jgi:uncharacterized protein (DUF58 family)
VTAQSFSLNPAVHVRARFQQWWQARLRPTDNHTLTQRNVYILPTRPGFMLGATLLLLLVASINYQLNLGYVLTFMLAGSAVVGMHLCHGTLKGLTLRLTTPAPQFAGQMVPLDVTLNSTTSGTRHGIGLSVLGSGQWAWTDVPAQGSSALQIAWQAPARGLHTVPTLTAETRFPMGTFRVWTVWRPAAQLLVYPAPEAFSPPLPPGTPRTGGMAATVSRGMGEFDGVRAYRRGDALKSVVWKKAARAMATGSGELVSRDDQHHHGHELWLNYVDAGSGGKEGRLSRLCAWLLQADRLSLVYGLRVPGKEIAPGVGEAHKRQCLEALALC